MSAIGTKRKCQPALMNVRFEGNNGHDADVMRCLLMTLNGLLALRTELRNRAARAVQSHYRLHRDQVRAVL